MTGTAEPEAETERSDDAVGSRGGESRESHESKAREGRDEWTHLDNQKSLGTDAFTAPGRELSESLSREEPDERSSEGVRSRQKESSSWHVDGVRQEPSHEEPVAEEL